VSARKTAWGGPRPGSGRPRFAAGEVRNCRVVVLLTSGEFTKLERLARERALPIGTAAYEIVERALRRRKA